MKKSILFIPLVALMFTACKKENVVQVTDNKGVSALASSGNPLMDEGELSTFFSDINELEEGYSMDDFNFSEEYDAEGTLIATQMMAIYKTAAGDYLNVSVADFSNMPSSAINNYLAGTYFVVGTDIRWPLPTKLVLSADPSQGYVLQTGTGVGPIKLATDMPQSNNYSGLFSEPLIPADGSFVRATTISSTSDVAGWEVYDNATDAGMMVLIVNGKYAVTIDGTAVSDDISILNGIASQINFNNFPI